MSDQPAHEPHDSGNVATEYQALTQGAAVVDLGQRAQVELTGEDRATFLHNLCTNEIRRLAPGGGCEAFLLNAQGKTQFHVLVFCTADALVLDAMAGAGELLLAHLDRYLIRDRVELADRSSEFGQFLLSGSQAGPLLDSLGATPPTGRLEHRSVQIGQCQVELRRVDMTNAGSVMLNVRAGDRDAVWKTLVAVGAAPCSQQAFDIARIEAGFPWFGRDITSDNLPQEVARDERTISFVKGCYIGQETVARIDALGHVNKTLCGLRVASAGDMLAPGAELTSNGKVVGHITSIASVPNGGAVALGYVRRGSNQPGTTLQCGATTVEVTRLPM